MLKSVFLAGFFLVTSNFLPSTPVGVPTVVAAHNNTLLTKTITESPADISAPDVVAPTTDVVLAARTGRVPAVKSAVVLDGQEAAGLTPEEMHFIVLINRERTKRGLSALAVDPLLVEVARGHSLEMCDRDYFDHHSPTAGLGTPMDRYLRGLRDGGLEAPRYALVGENIYYCSETNETYNVAYGHQALMNSPGHRANILEPRFAKVGVGIHEDARGQFWVTEMFLKDTAE